MDTREWFNEDTYSDLKIKLSNGNEIKVHKAIVCRANEYFRKLCGPESHFAESRQSTVELKDDDSVALNAVLRHIYKLDVLSDAPQTRTWREWLDLRTTADKYLEPELSKVADNHFHAVVLKSTDADDIFDIIEAINNEMAHDEHLVGLANKIRKRHRGKLLKNDRFRAQLERGGKEALWEVIDELVFAVDLEEARFHLCGPHWSTVFQRPSESKTETAPCSFCENRSRERNRVALMSIQLPQEQTAWI